MSIRGFLIGAKKGRTFQFNLFRCFPLYTRELLETASSTRTNNIIRSHLDMMQFAVM